MIDSADVAVSEALYRTMFEEAGAAMSQAALDGTWLRVNRRMGEMLGYPQDELVGRRFYDAPRTASRRWLPAFSCTCPSRSSPSGWPGRWQAS